MTDRELLEAAAKTSGMLKWQHTWVDAGLNVGDDKTPAIWNPLADDGDALRLAVKLGLMVDCTRSSAEIPGSGFRCVQDHGNDPASATRRAIVRAAAAMAAA